MRYFVEDCKTSSSNEAKEIIVNRFNNEINEGVRELEDRLSILKKKNYIDIISGSIATTSITIFTLSEINIPEIVPPLVGTGSLSILMQLKNYLLDLRNLKRDKFHFIWKVKRLVE